MIFANRNCYVGEFQSGKMQGHGEIRYVSGGLYVGDFVNGVKEGNGKYTWKSGDSYNGQWKRDKMHGSGVQKFADTNKIIQGTWTYGKFTS